MKHVALTLLILAVSGTAKTQKYDASAIFAHNDYLSDVPFHSAYNQNAGFIEADVFLTAEGLMVAHQKNEISAAKTLQSLYLQPLLQKVKQYDGFVYQNRERALTLMIDLKTDGAATLSAIVQALEQYPELITCPTLRFMISGSVPDPTTWEAYPPYITFDGRPTIQYTPKQLERVAMISTNFRDHIRWPGSGPIPEEAATHIINLMDEAHSLGKVFRFWATPDHENAWREFMRLQMDVIVTDDVAALAAFLANHSGR